MKKLIKIIIKNKFIAKLLQKFILNLHTKAYAWSGFLAIIAVYKKELGLEYMLDKTHYTEYTYEQLKNELTQANIDILSYHIKFGEIYLTCEAK